MCYSVTVILNALFYGITSRKQHKNFLYVLCIMCKIGDFRLATMKDPLSVKQNKIQKNGYK